MDDKELVEVWQCEFESMDDLESFIFDKDDFGRYTSSRTDGRWQGFLIAKRSQKVIELPLLIDIYTEDIAGNFYHEDAIHAAITAAGYQFKVKE